MSHYAIIDLGTNTCNLLISKLLPNGKTETLYDRKLPVKLGRGGIHKNILLPDAIERGIKVLQNHAITIATYGVSNIKVIGTSALRGAAHRDEFLLLVKEMLGWEIEIIDGELEAALIFRGVTLTLPESIGKYLIVDIGGGSTEFILAQDNRMIWKKSFNIGIARALETIQMSDPVTSDEITNFENWFNDHLTELWDICKQHHPSILVGCSGAFDTFMDIYEQEEPDLKIRNISEFPLVNYRKIHEQLIKSDHETRAKMRGMDKMRVEMIVIASVFTNFILQRLQINKLLHTHNSLKEGAMDRFITNGI